METSRRKGWRKKGVKGLIKVTLTSVAPALIPLIRGFHPRCIICGVASILPWIDTWCESEKVFEGRGWRARSFSSYAVAWMLNGSCDLSGLRGSFHETYEASWMWIVRFRENNRAGFNRRWDINEIFMEDYERMSSIRWIERELFDTFFISSFFPFFSS